MKRVLKEGEILYGGPIVVNAITKDRNGNSIEGKVAYADQIWDDEHDCWVSEYYSKMINGIFEIKVVAELPVDNISPSALYLLLNTDPEDENKYDEYVYLPAFSKWEKIGSTKINLDDYVKFEDLTGYAKLEDIPTIPTDVSAFNNDAGYLTEHQSLDGYAKTEDIPVVPTNVSAFNNDAGYLTTADKYTPTYVDDADINGLFVLCDNTTHTEQNKPVETPNEQDKPSETPVEQNKPTETPEEKTPVGKLSGYTATEIAAMMTTGWNLGNTLDATGGGNSLSAETSWNQPKTTQEMISAVRAAGFNTIRIPVSWGNHTTGGEEWIIDEDWMNRVKEVVDYAYNEEMFVIINIHHDNYPGNIHYMPEDDDESYIFITQIWRQIAEAFKDYDQHLVFEIMHEPRLVGYSSEWHFDIDNPDSRVKEALRMINWYNQIGVDETRRNGSPENMDRVIMCPGYAALWEGCMSPEFELPTDTINNRLALSLHAYIPYDLCLGSGKVWIDSYADEIDSYFKAVYDKFIVGQGVPVIIGEESCSYKNNGGAILNWIDVYYNTIKKYGMPGILWDNNIPKNNGGEAHGQLDRVNLIWYHPDFINAIMEIVGVKNVSIPTDQLSTSYKNGLATGATYESLFDAIYDDFIKIDANDVNDTMQFFNRLPDELKNQFGYMGVSWYDHQYNEDWMNGFLKGVNLGDVTKEEKLRTQLNAWLPTFRTLKSFM